MPASQLTCFLYPLHAVIPPIIMNSLEKRGFIKVMQTSVEQSGHIIRRTCCIFTEVPVGQCSAPDFTGGILVRMHCYLASHPDQRELAWVAHIPQTFSALDLVRISICRAGCSLLPGEGHNTILPQGLVGGTMGFNPWSSRLCPPTC